MGSTAVCSNAMLWCAGEFPFMFMFIFLLFVLFCCSGVVCVLLFISLVVFLYIVFRCAAYYFTLFRHNFQSLKDECYVVVGHRALAQQ